MDVILAQARRTWLRPAAWRVLCASPAGPRVESCPRRSTERSPNSWPRRSTWPWLGREWRTAPRHRREPAEVATTGTSPPRTSATAPTSTCTAPSRRTTSSPRTRPQGTAQVRVFTPAVSEDGWTAGGHSVVEVVTDDMPFLVDSVTMELTRQQRDVHVVIHPQFDVTATSPARSRRSPRSRTARSSRRRTRSASPGCTSRSTGSPTTRTPARSRSRCSTCCATSASRSRTGRRCTRQVLAIVDELKADPPPLTEEEIAQGSELLRWLADDHFTFLGYREYRLERDGDDEMLRAVPGTGLGILRADQDMSASFGKLPAAGQAEGAREDPAGAGQGQLAGDRAPAGVPRLRRREDSSTRTARSSASAGSSACSPAPPTPSR